MTSPYQSPPAGGYPPQPVTPAPAAASAPNPAAKSNQTVAALVVAGCVVLIGVAAQMQFNAFVDRFHGGASGSPRTVQDAQHQIDDVLAAGAPGTPATHAITQVRDCSSGQGGTLTSTVVRPDALNALVGVDEQLQAHGWHLTQSAGQSFTVTATYRSADGTATIDLFGDGHNTSTAAHFAITTNLGCS